MNFGVATEGLVMCERKFGAVLVYRYTGEFLLFSYPYMELWRSSLMFRSFVYRYTRTQPKIPFYFWHTNKQSIFKHDAFSNEMMLQVPEKSKQREDLHN